MSALLDSLLPRCEPEPEAEPVYCSLLSDEQCAAMDDMAGLEDA